MGIKLKLAYTALALAGVATGFAAARYWFTQPPTMAPETAAEMAATAQHDPPTTLPEFSLKNRAGELQSIHSFTGKSLILNFWATWCAPCRREIPLLKELNRQHAADGFQVVGIAVDFREDVLKYADTMHIDYPLLIGEQDGLAAVDAFGLASVGFPFTVFTDAHGNIIAMHQGELKAAQATLALATIKRLNQGEIALAAARTEVTAGLSRLSEANSPD